MLDARTKAGYRRGMRISAIIALSILTGLVSACGDPLPDLDARLSQTSRNADYPELVPLGPLVEQRGALLPLDTATEGETLEARAAALRTRAAILQAMPL